MNMNYDLPFKVGHLVEARSFVPGYRSSWFRCMVREVSWRKGSIGCILEYIDFPDERKKWTKLYQISPTVHGKKKNVKRELMVRPCYPPIYQEDHIEKSRKSLEVAVIVSNDWKVGDLVDWWADNVHWCGELIQLLDAGKAKIKLPDPPIGEGLIYDVELKDIRPTLSWSPEQGWIVPVNQVDENRHCCARMIQPTNQGMDVCNSYASPYISDPGERTTFPGQKDTQMSPSEFSASCSSHASPTLSSLLRTEGNHSADPDEVKECTESSESDTIKASIMKLEELACKVKWLKMVLNHGSALLNTLPSWKFEDNLVTSTPKPDSSTGMKETKTLGAHQNN